MFTEPSFAKLTTKIVTAFSFSVSCPFYIVVLFVIYKNRKNPPFDSPFFTLYITLGIVDIVSYVMYTIRKMTYWDVQLFFLKPYNEPNVSCKIIMFIIFWLAYMQFQLTIISCLNRFTAIVLSEFYSKYWTKRSTKLVICLTTLSAMCLALPILFFELTVNEHKSIADGIPIIRLVGPAFILPEVSQAHLLSWKVHVYAILIICTVCYVVMFIKIKKIRALLNSPTMQRELRLLYPMTVLYVSNLLYIGYFVLCDYWKTTHVCSQNSEWTMYVASDAYDLNNCYVIMITSREVRIAVLKFLKVYWCVKKRRAAVSFTKPSELPDIALKI